MNLNLSKFKKIKENPGSAILEHPNGHRFIVNKGSLKKEHLDELGKLPIHLAAGGELGDAEDFKDQPQQQVSPQAPVTINIGQPAPQAAPPLSSQISSLKQMDDQDAAQAKAAQDEAQAKRDRMAELSQYNALAAKHGASPVWAAGAGTPYDVSSPPAPPPQAQVADTGAPGNPAFVPDAPSANDLSINQKILNDPNVPEASKAELRASMGMPTAAPNAGAMPPAASGQPVNALREGLNTTAQTDPYGLKTAEAGVNTQIAATQETGKLEAEQARETAKLYKSDQFDQGLALVKKQQDDEAVEAEANKIIADKRNGFLNPNHYIANMSTGSKIMTAIGLALGGFSNAINHTGNPAMEFLNKQIENDIAAQKENQNIQTDLLTAIQNKFGRTERSYNIYHAARLGMLADDIAEQAQKSGDPLAIQRANGLVGGLLKYKSDVLKQDTMMSGLADMSNNPAGTPAGASPNPTAKIERMISNMRMMGDPRAEVYGKMLVPGVGLATREVASADREKLIAGQDFQNKMIALEKFAQEHSGTVADRATVNQGIAMAAAAQNSFRTAQSLGVYKAGEQSFNEKVIPSDPTAFGAKWRTLPKYREMRKQALSELNLLKKDYSLPMSEDYSKYEGDPSL